jgi:hypothetical protein
MIIIPHTEVQQGTPEWFALRLGKPSASKAACILTSTGKVSAQRDKYIRELAGQRVSGRIEPTYKNAYMDEGHEKENDSRLEYEIMNNVEVTQVACVFPDENRRYLCSPDGLILSQQRGFETKNAIFSIQIERLKRRRPDPEHFCQVQASMLVCDYPEWIYQSYCEGLPTLTLVIKKDLEYCVRLKHELDKFCDELDAMCVWLESLKQ